MSESTPDDDGREDKPVKVITQSVVEHQQKPDPLTDLRASE